MLLDPLVKMPSSVFLCEVTRRSYNCFPITTTPLQKICPCYIFVFHYRICEMCNVIYSSAGVSIFVMNRLPIRPLCHPKKFKMHNVQCTMHNAKCPMHNAQCPMSNARNAMGKIQQAKLKMTHSKCAMQNAH